MAPMVVPALIGGILGFLLGIWALAVLDVQGVVSAAVAPLVFALCGAALAIGVSTLAYLARDVLFRRV